MPTDGESDFVSGLVFGIGIVAGGVAVMVLFWGLFGVMGAAASAYDDACSTQEISVENEDGEPVVYIEDRDPSWFCITSSDDSEEIRSSAYHLYFRGNA